MAKSKATHKETIVIVEGTGDFPIDMLRYDACVPALERDTHGLLDTDGSETPRRVTLRRYSTGTAPATAARWKSFGWRVVADSMLDPSVTLYWGR